MAKVKGEIIFILNRCIDNSRKVHVNLVIPFRGRENELK